MRRMRRAQTFYQCTPHFPLGYPTYHEMETVRPVIEVHLQGAGGFEALVLTLAGYALEAFHDRC